MSVIPFVIHPNPEDRQFAEAVHTTSGVCADELLGIMKAAAQRLAPAQQAALSAYLESTDATAAAELLGCSRQSMSFRLWGQQRRNRVKTPGVFERLVAALTTDEYEDLMFWHRLHQRFLRQDCPDAQQTLFEAMSNVHFFTRNE